MLIPSFLRGKDYSNAQVRIEIEARRKHTYRQDVSMCKGPGVSLIFLKHTGEHCLTDGTLLATLYREPGQRLFLTQERVN